MYCVVCTVAMCDCHVEIKKKVTYMIIAYTKYYYSEITKKC